MTNYERFTRLHQQEKPLLLGNAWNTHSAKLFEKAGYEAIGTSSVAVANTWGYDDGEKISFAELFFVVERIVRAVSIPLTVDLERGYGHNTAEAIANIEKLHDIGVAGINLEDSIPGDGQKQLLPLPAAGEKIAAIKNQLAPSNRHLFINARTDAYALKLPDALQITLERIKAYEQAGADGIFVPFLTDEADIQAITSSTRLPVNVFNIPGLPSFERLGQLGVRRVSLGGTAFRAAYRPFETLIKNVYSNKSLTDLF